MTPFTPWTALAGGALIGIAAALLLALNGRVAGVSGILAAFIQERGRAAWQGAFVVGLVAGAGLASLAGLGEMRASPVARPMLLIAGLLVGFGTRMGGGCTSGHGVCGVGRLSVRSMVATCAFLAAGIATVFVVRHVFA
jgi:uncharacterized membrane protein YedE/YeeE